MSNGITIGSVVEVTDKYNPLFEKIGGKTGVVIRKYYIGISYINIEIEGKIYSLPCSAVDYSRECYHQKLR